MQNVDGKVVIVTGASSGIGAETARVLVANGAKVVLSARRGGVLATCENSLARYARRRRSAADNRRNGPRSANLLASTSPVTSKREATTAPQTGAAMRLRLDAPPF